MTTPQVSAAAGAQLTQAGLASLTAAQAAVLARSLDTNDLSRSLPGFVAALWQLIRRHGLASGGLSSRFYVRQRAAAGITAPFRPVIPDPPPVEQVAASVRWAVQPFYEGTPDLRVFTTKVSGAAEKLVLDVGRDTILHNVQRDKQAKGWARVPEPGACYFCALLATRGAVYRSEGSADFQSHDHCRCHAEPVFTAYEPSAQVRDWQVQYAQATAGVHGMKNLQRAWRAAYEGRTAQ